MKLSRQNQETLRHILRWVSEPAEWSALFFHYKRSIVQKAAKGYELSQRAYTLLGDACEEYRKQKGAWV